MLPNKQIKIKKFNTNNTKKNVNNIKKNVNNIKKKFLKFNIKNKFLKFNIKNKKNLYWKKRNKWKYFFSEANQWFVLKKKIKNNFFFFNKSKRHVLTFFYYETNFTHFFTQNDFSKFDFSIITNKIWIMQKKNLIFFFKTKSLFLFQFLYYKLINKNKNFTLFSYFYYFLNKKSFLFTFNKTNNFVKLTTENVKKSSKNNFLYSSLFTKNNIYFSNTKYQSKLPYKTPNKRKSFLINSNAIGFLRLNCFKLTRLFYKTNKYGFFLLNSMDFHSKGRFRIGKHSLNLNKFFLFNKISQNNLKKKTTSYCAQTNFFYEKSTLSSFLRYTNWNIFININNQKKNIQSYFFFYKKKTNSLMYKKINLDSLNFNNKKFKKVITYENSKNLLTNFAHIQSKILSLVSNVEFFFSNTLTITVFKFLLFKNNTFNNSKTFSTINSFLNFYFNNFYFYSKTAPSTISTNLFALNQSFNFTFKKFLIKTFSSGKFTTEESPLHYEMISRFLEFCSGKKIYATFNPFMVNLLNFEEKALCMIWSQKIKSFRKVLGPRLFLNESLQIIYFCLKNKDVYVLSSWMLQMFYKISFWKYKLFFRYLQYVLRYFFWSIFDPLKITGLKFQMKGKISVAGNARTRTVLNKIGTAGHSSFKNQILYDLKLIRTFTGVIGFKTWMFF